MNNTPSTQYINEKQWNIIMFIALLALFVLAYVFNDYNFAHSIGTQSRALYVDEGFYSDAAQNLIKTGSWEVAYDSRHWPGSPLSLVLQSVVFSVFGASITVARMFSVLLGMMGAWALFSIAKTRFTPGVSVLLTLSSLSAITYVTVARFALTDPMAMSMSLLAMWSFVRLENRHIALPLSLGFAFLAFFSKMYFLFAIASLVAVWLGELILLPLLYRGVINRRLLWEFFYSLVIIALFYLLYRQIFSAGISNFMAINSNKTPHLDLLWLYASIRHSILYLPLHTQSLVFFWVLGMAAIYSLAHLIVVRLLWPQKSPGFLVSLSRISRAEWVMGLFLVSGLLTIGVLRLHKTHYHFFAIIPFAFLAIAAMTHLLHKKFVVYASVAVLLGHLAFQIPAYSEWIKRPNGYSIATASKDVAARIEQAVPDGMIPVFGEYSAQLGLYGKRINSIDAKWVSQSELCQRIDYWKPQYHVNIVWPNSASRKMLDKIVACPGVNHSREIVRYRTFGELNDYLVLNKIEYGKSVLAQPVPIPLLLL